MTAHNIEVQYLGHGTFKFKTPAQKTLLIDPWLRENPSCPEECKRVPQLDTLLITHGHFDHVSDAVSLAKEHEPAIGCIWELGLWLEQQGVSNVSAMNKGGSQQLNDIRVTMTDARHSSGWMDEQGNLIYLGEPAGYVIEFENGYRIYFAGDTCVFGDMQIIGELYQPHLSFLPIGDLYTMDPRQAAYACRLLKCPRVIPMHYATFPPLVGTPQQLREALGDSQTEVTVMRPGETIAL